MKKCLLAATALALVAGIGTASAADLPIRKGPPVAPVYVPPAFTWTGFYVGVNAGGAWANRDNNNIGFPFVGAVPVGGFFPATRSGNNGGFIGGVQAGYNYQFTPGAGFVLGVETDIDYADIGHNNNSVGFGSFTLPQFPGTTFTSAGVASHNNNNQWLGTARLRAGYAWDRFLVYGTGGLAYGGINNNHGVAGGFTATTNAGFINPVSGVPGPSTAFLGGAAGGGSSSRVGWTLGAGAEYAIWSNLTIKAEYLYANLGHSNNNNGVIFLPGATAVTGGHRDVNVNIVRVGLNYKFW